MILFAITLLIAPLFGEKNNLWRNPDVLANENDPNRNTIYDEYIVCFNITCLERMEQDTRNIIQEFLDLFECYSLNKEVKDQYPNIEDH